MRHVLLVYASHFGQTHKIADCIASRLRTLGFAVDVANASKTITAVPSPATYDGVVLGSRIEMGKHAATIFDYIRAHRTTLERVPTAFFSVSMAAAGEPAEADPESYLARTFEQAGWTPTEHAAFGGGLPYREYGWVLRFVMKRISRRAGHPTDTTRDHVFTDFGAVEAFADRYAAQMDRGIANGAQTVREIPKSPPHERF